jgi:hypothetical protein
MHKRFVSAEPDSCSDSYRIVFIIRGDVMVNVAGA